MLAPPEDSFHLPLWRSHPLSPWEEQELELDFSDLELAGEIPHRRAPSEGALVSRIRVMLVIEQSQALEAIRYSLGKHNQTRPEGRALPDKDGGAPPSAALAEESCSPGGSTKAQLGGKQLVSSSRSGSAQGPAPDLAVRKLLEFLNLDPQKDMEKALLFRLYGLILRECPTLELVERHLAGLLELSHQSSSDREGIALAVGLASARHLEEVWARLEHLGRTRFLRLAAVSPDCQPEPDLHWRWVSSTSLLCYGQMAMHAKDRVLPWVDNIVSRMVYYFSCSPCGQDEVLKSSFLVAAIMLTRALRHESRSQTYRFTQIPELIQCLLDILQKEPNFLATLFRQKIILVVVGLSGLRPTLRPLVKSRLLQICLRSVFALPATEALKSSLPPLEPAPDVMMLYKKTVRALNLLLQNFVSESPSMDEVCFLLQHVEYWLKSERSHERRRAVQAILQLLQYIVDRLRLTEEAMPSILGHQIGLLTLLWRDKDEAIRHDSQHCVFLLLQLVAQQKGSSAEHQSHVRKLVEITHWNKMKHFEVRASREWEMKLYHMVKAFEEDLTVAQHTQLVLTLLHGACSRSHLRSDLASKLLLMVFQDPGVRTEQVAEILQALCQELPAIHLKSTQETMMKATAALGSQHTQEVVEVALSLSCPLERQVLLLWKALATNHHLARQVITLLYTKVKLRPPRELIWPNQQAQLTSLLALSTIYELLYTQEYRSTVRWAFAGILLGLLTQLHYLFELGMVEGILDYKEDILDSKPIGPCRTCLEALKGLFWTTQSWEVFAQVKLLQGWELFEDLKTYTEGVTLLARAMAHYNCEVKAVLGQAVISLKSTEERDNIVAILIITEFLNSPEISPYVSWKAMNNCLSLGLNNSNQLVRAMSLKGLSSLGMHPKKVGLLQNQLTQLLPSFLQPEPKDPRGLMEILGDLLHHLGVQCVGAISLKIAQHLLPLFEDERAEVRGGAIFLFGDVIHKGGRKFREALKELAFQAVVPLLFHLVDQCPEVVTKTKFTFLRCAILLKWEFRKELFSKLAWGRGLSTENDVFIYVVESSFGNHHQFLMQALTYLDSSHRNLKVAAMKFIGGMLQDYFTDLCFHLKKDDVQILKNYMEALRRDPDSACRKFYFSFLEDVRALAHYVS